jgi:hypothetical protein
MGGSGRVWHDEHLLRDGAMNPADIAGLVDEWTKLGFEPFEEQGEAQIWKDCCVVEGMFGGPTLPCDWLEISEDGRSAGRAKCSSDECIGKMRSICSYSIHIWGFKSLHSTRKSHEIMTMVIS